MDRKRLFVGIPSVDGKVSVALHRYLFALGYSSLVGELPYEVNEGIAEGIAPVEYARNILVKMALDWNADKLLMIDTDMLPGPETSRVLMSEADVIVPRMFRFRHSISGPEAGDPELATCATIVREDGSLADIIPERSASSAFQVDAVGTGFVMIDRKVLIDPRMRLGPDDDDGVPAVFGTVRTATGKISEWEDIGFSLRASRLGYSVVVDMGARCGHRKSINLDAVAELALQDRVGA